MRALLIVVAPGIDQQRPIARQPQLFAEMGIAPRRAELIGIHAQREHIDMTDERICRGARLLEAVAARKDMVISYHAGHDHAHGFLAAVFSLVFAVRGVLSIDPSNISFCFSI